MICHSRDSQDPAACYGDMFRSSLLKSESRVPAITETQVRVQARTNPAVRDRDHIPGPVSPAEAVGKAVVADCYLDRFVVLRHGGRRKGTGRTGASRNELWLRSGSSRVSLPEKLKVAKDRQHLLPDVVWQHAPGVDDQLQVRVVHAMCMLAALRSAPGPPQIPGEAITRFLK